MKGKIHILLQMKCTQFFQQNSGAFESIEGLSLKLGRSVGQLEEVLSILCKINILEKKGEGAFSFYRYQLPDVNVILKQESEDT
ncbi:hypothetical protein H1230_26985 [Paenibacillus sp. 19GGS1-52]|uniref:hypothetical protein n=1 Tax=Paenibacillus sp. 19GGS1-52 TaxID=2758563 RepID=UPI001EFB7922|nr:hypothetical protein [Paenibacillus sp. 19GGS1-52]ULO06602.1 hypothetical protein H1230_26985 [Paenibacillus sp. 19GGS1-52]